VIAIIGMVWTVQAAARQNLLQTAGAVVALAAAGWVAVVVGLRIVAENKRVAAEEAERQQRETSYCSSTSGGQHRLSDRPDDMEMGRGCDCDRRLLLQHSAGGVPAEVERHQRVRVDGGRGEGSKRARAKNGPWRYSRYKLLVFLLTADGVRQITVELNFSRATFTTGSAPTTASTRSPRCG
jgi:hypothetical protein